MNPRRFDAFTLLLCGLMIGSSVRLCDAHTAYVPAQFSTIQPALDASTSGDTVLVAAGTYSGAGDSDLRFRDKDLVLLSESGAASTTIDLGGTQVSALVLRANETRAAVLDGFTVCNGATNAIICDGSAAPTIRNCIIRDNEAHQTGPICPGGIMVLDYGAPLITGCDFERNTGDSGGAIGIAEDARPEILDCTFRENNAWLGGGIYCTDDCLPVIRNCLFSGNGFYSGGAIQSFSSHTVEVSDCEISRNWGSGIGGGSMHIVGCTITRNGEDTYGGGGLEGGPFRVERSIIWGNCGPRGSDIYADGRVQLTCCAWSDSGVFVASHGQLVVTGPQVKTDPRFCAPLPCPTGPHQDPGGDYTLRSDSPCLAQFSPCQEQIGDYGVGCAAPAPVGACCLDNAFTCALATQADCASKLGRYLGDGSSCYPDPCAPTAVKVTTWGQIKNMYK